MNINDNFEKILKKNLTDELKWVEEEIDLIFGNKDQNLSEQEKKSAKKILENLTDTVLDSDNDDIFFLFSDIFEKIKKKHPHIFS